MKTLLLFFGLLVFAPVSAQIDGAPPPPRIPYPAEYPNGGNAEFVKQIIKNLDLNLLKDQEGTLRTKVIIEVRQTGFVKSINTVGENKVFNAEVKRVANKLALNETWHAGKNSRGEQVVDIVTLPVIYKKLIK